MGHEPAVPTHTTTKCEHENVSEGGLHDVTFEDSI